MPRITVIEPTIDASTNLPILNSIKEELRHMHVFLLIVMSNTHPTKLKSNITPNTLKKELIGSMLILMLMKVLVELISKEEKLSTK